MTSHGICRRIFLLFRSCPGRLGRHDVWVELHVKRPWFLLSQMIARVVRKASYLPADIVKADYFSLLVLHDNKVETCHLVLYVVSHISIASFVRDQKPSFRENGAPLELVD